MKYLILISLIVGGSVWAKNSHKLHHAINEDVQKEIQHDESKFKKEVKIMRGPASVEPEKMPVYREPSKLDKKDRQIGPHRW